MRSINAADASTRQPVVRHASCIRAAVFMESPISAISFLKIVIRHLTRGLYDAEASKNRHLHKIQDDGEGSGGNKGARYHPCRLGRHHKASDC